jgi:hypothetical protein
MKNYQRKVKVKEKFTLEQATKALRGSRGIALLFPEPQHWMGVGGQRHPPAALPPGNTQYPLYRRLGGTQGWSGWVRKISPPQGFDPRTIQPVVSRYTDWAVPAHMKNDQDRDGGHTHTHIQMIVNPKYAESSSCVSTVIPHWR